MLQIPTADEVLEKIDGDLNNAINQGIQYCINTRNKEFLTDFRLPDECITELRKKGYEAIPMSNNITKVVIVGTKYNS